MNNNKLNTNGYTKDLISRSEIQQPGPDFTKNVMRSILKSPAVKVSFITKDDKKNNFWLIITMAVMFIGFVTLYYVKYGLNFSKDTSDLWITVYIKAVSGFFSVLWAELTISPYILVALAGVVFLVIIDKTIVKYLYSI